MHAWDEADLEEEGDEDERTGLLSPSREPAAEPALSILTVAALSYFSVCGGPFGLELGIAAAGPGLLIGALLLLTIVWAVPCALMTAELSSALPSSGGYMHWVRTRRRISRRRAHDRPLARRDRWAARSASDGARSTAGSRCLTTLSTPPRTQPCSATVRSPTAPRRRRSK